MLQKLTCIPLTKNIHETNAQISTAVTVKSLCKVALHKIPLGGAFVHANIYKLYLLYSHARNSLISNVI